MVCLLFNNFRNFCFLITLIFQLQEPLSIHSVSGGQVTARATISVAWDVGQQLQWDEGSAHALTQNLWKNFLIYTKPDCFCVYEAFLGAVNRLR